jgi:hypothetical protein
MKMSSTVHHRLEVYMASSWAAGATTCSGRARSTAPGVDLHRSALDEVCKDAAAATRCGRM